LVATAHPTAVAVFGTEREVDTSTAATVALASVMGDSLAHGELSRHNDRNALPESTP
jgi:hypothetical protein